VFDEQSFDQQAFSIESWIFDLVAAAGASVRHVPRLARLKIRPKKLPDELPDPEELFIHEAADPVAAAGRVIRSRSRRDEHFILH
jgi:hypothetical protein